MIISHQSMCQKGRFSKIQSQIDLQIEPVRIFPIKGIIFQKFDIFWNIALMLQHQHSGYFQQNI